MALTIFLFLFQIPYPSEVMNRFVRNGTVNFGRNIPTEISGPPPEVIPNIPVGRNRNSPFHLNSDRNFRILWHDGKHPHGSHMLPTLRRQVTGRWPFLTSSSARTRTRVSRRLLQAGVKETLESTIYEAVTECIKNGGERTCQRFANSSLSNWLRHGRKQL